MKQTKRAIGELTQVWSRADTRPLCDRIRSEAYEHGYQMGYYAGRRFLQKKLTNKTRTKRVVGLKPIVALKSSNKNQIERNRNHQDMAQRRRS